MKKKFFLILLLYCEFIFSQSTVVDKRRIENDLVHWENAKVVSYVDTRLSQGKNLDPAHMAVLQAYKAEALVNLRLYDEAIVLANEQLQDTHLSVGARTRLLLVMALTYELLEDFKKAWFYMDKAEAVLKQNLHLKPEHYTYFLVRKASLLRVQDDDDHDDFFAATSEAIAYGTEVKDVQNTALAHMLAGFYYRDKDFSKTLAHYRIILRINKSVQNKDGIGSMYFNIAKLYLKNGDVGRAHRYIDSAGVTLRGTDYYETISIASEIKSRIFEKENRLDSALYYYKKAIANEKKYDLGRKQIQVKELTLRLEKEKEIINKKEVEAKNRNLKTVLLITTAALLVLIFLLWMVYKGRRKIENRNRVISAAAKNLKSLVGDKVFLIQELNHRVKNNLSIILSLVRFQKDEIDDVFYKDKFGQLYQRIQTIALTQSLYNYDVDSEVHEMINLKDNISRILDSMVAFENRNIEISFHCDPLLMNPGKALPLGLIINELVTNSVKHATVPAGQPLQIRLNITKEDREITARYSDSGTEFTVSGGKTLGLLIISGMTAQLDGSCERVNSCYTIKFYTDE